MVGFFKKKNKIQKLVEKLGIETATDQFSDFIGNMLKNRTIAYQFILEEIEAASGGNQKAKKFSSESGIPSTEYEGAMKRSYPEIDGPNGPQQFLLNASAQLISDENLMVEFRTKIVDKIMKKFCLGIYEGDLQPNIIISYTDSLERYKSDPDVKEFELMMNFAIGDISERNSLTVGMCNSMRERFDNSFYYAEQILTGAIDANPQNNINLIIINHLGACFWTSKHDKLLLRKLAEAYYNMKLFNEESLELLCTLVAVMTLSPKNIDDLKKKTSKLYKEMCSPVLQEVFVLREEMAQSIRDEFYSRKN